MSNVDFKEKVVKHNDVTLVLCQDYMGTMGLSLETGKLFNLHISIIELDLEELREIRDFLNEHIKENE